MLTRPTSIRNCAVALLAFCGALSHPAAAAGWEFVAPMPFPKANTCALRFNGDIYMVGGSPWVNEEDQDGSVYKFKDGAWSVVAPLTGMGPTVGQGAGVDALNQIIVFGGLTLPSDDIAEARAYDPIEGTTFTVPTGGLSDAPINFGTAVDGQGRIYRMGGGPGASGFNTGVCSRYLAASNTWQAVAFLPFTRAAIASAYDDQGHIWSFGGYSSFGLPRLLDTARYTVATNTWTVMGGVFLPVATSNARAVTGADGRVYVVGGLHGSSAAGIPHTTVHVLDVDNETLSLGPSLNVPRYNFGIVRGDDGYIYAIGGLTTGGVALNSVERLYTAPCPSITGYSPSATVVVGQTVQLAATTVGGAPQTFTWTRNGVTLVDGPTGNGSAIEGASTSTLKVISFTQADAGAFVFTATNPCGSASTPDIVLSIGVVGDLNGDAIVDGVDLAIVLGLWGPCAACDADLDGNGVVDGADLAIILGNWSTSG